MAKIKDEVVCTPTSPLSPFNNLLKPVTKAKRMELRWKMLPPQALFLYGRTSDLDLKTKFKHNHFSVKFELSGDHSVSVKKLKGSKYHLDIPENMQYFRSINSFDFLIQCEEKDSSDLSNLVSDSTKYPQLLQLLTQIVNRIIRSIRNFGFVANINEIHPQYENAEHYLWLWEVATSSDGEAWTPIVPSSGGLLKTLAFFSSERETTTIDAEHWPDIEEGIQDKLEPQPEQEFFTNALEHMRRSNYRLAVVESIICLEIVLSQFLREYLSKVKNISEKRIEDFLKPQLGLTARVSALLDITLPPDALTDVDINKVLKCIEWRNKIVHRTGHLTNNLDNETIREGVLNVLVLSHLLARERDQIIAEPKIRKLIQEVVETYGITIPMIQTIGRHRILMEFNFILESKFPDKNILDALVSDISSRLSERDNRFNANKDLFIRFMVFPRKIRARWFKGQLEIINQKRS